MYSYVLQLPVASHYLTTAPYGAHDFIIKLMCDNSNMIIVNINVIAECIIAKLKYTAGWLCVCVSQSSQCSYL